MFALCFRQIRTLDSVAQTRQTVVHYVDFLTNLRLFFHFSSICLMYSVAAAVPHYKMRDSKISRIQPFTIVQSSTRTGTGIPAKYLHDDKYLNKSHVRKNGLDSKKRSLTNHDILKQVIL